MMLLSKIAEIQNAENDETEEDEFEIPAFLRRQKN